jgi:hypothetical protein
MLKRSLELSYDLACRWWKRPDLEEKPENIYRVAGVLEEAGIEVYEVSPKGWLSCEPRPYGVREALSGEAIEFDTSCLGQFPNEQIGCVLQYLHEKGFSLCAQGRKEG